MLPEEIGLILIFKQFCYINHISDPYIIVSVMTFEGKIEVD